MKLFLDYLSAALLYRSWKTCADRTDITCSYD